MTCDLSPVLHLETRLSGGRLGDDALEDWWSWSGRCLKVEDVVSRSQESRRGDT